jgi:peptidoglycan hydrolase-like protein with peptidoglycan-binding domain
MKRYLGVFIALIFLSAVVGCGKKEAATEEMQEPMSMEAVSSINATTTQATPQQKAAEVIKVETAQPQAAQVVPMPTASLVKPSGKDIQTALKNAGYYSGPVDGKIGPLTKKAIVDFQTANKLGADGKVGPRTWSILGTYLNAPVAATMPAKQKKN